jgi:6-phosphogluconolactonase
VTRNLGELHVSPDAAGVAKSLADLFVDIGKSAIADRGSFSVALAGGNTPRAAYTLLGQRPEALCWSDVYVYFGDERCVPPDDDQSNYHMAVETFLSKVPIPETNVHRMRGEIDPPEAAREYASVMVERLGDPPRLDLIMLGMGPDGHTASLFPGADPETDASDLVRAVYAESQHMWRITFTPIVINSARNVVFAVEGSSKSATLAAVRQGEYDPRTYPSQIVSPSDGRLIWLVDESAAGQLQKR